MKRSIMSSPLQIAPLSRIDRLSVAAFREQYQRHAKPVVITNALSWPALGLWTHQWFRDQFGSLEVELSVNPTHTYKTVKMRLGAYINRILANDRMSGGLYLDQFPLERLPTLHRDFSVPAYCAPDKQITTHLWLGPSTTILGFHKDNHDPLIQIDNIFVQIFGRKRVLLASPDNDTFMYPRSPDSGAYWHSQVDPDAPDLERFPLFSRAHLQEAIVGPGDILYIPRNYWHRVQALERSISMSFWWLPCRLMEIAEQIVSTKDEHLDGLAAVESYRVSSRDIMEIGGPECFAQILAAFPDISLMQRLCRGLRLLADEQACALIDSALQGCISNAHQ